MQYFLIVLSFFSLSITASWAQQTLSEQFYQLKEESNNYQEYEVIPRTELDAFWSVVEDSLQKQRNGITQRQATIQNQEARIDTLEQTLQTRDEELAESEYNSSRLNVLGIPVQKNSYVVFSFALYTGLLVFGFIFLFRYRRSNVVAVEKRKEYELAQEELESYKKKSRDREIKLRRELQTEINRVEELKKKIGTTNDQAN